MPNRLNDFIKYYERPKTRKELSYTGYVIEDYLQGLVRKNSFGEVIVDTSAALPQFRQQLNILSSAKKDSAVRCLI